MITYKNAKGGRSNSSRGLAVPTKDRRGRRLPPAAAAEAARAAFVEGKRLWNELDQSSRPRFDVPGASSGGTAHANSLG